MAFKLSQKSRLHLTGVHPDLVRIIERALETSSIDFSIVQGVRTQEYQNNLYEQGRTKPGKVVTWTKKSRHIGGFAIDFAAYKDGAISWDEKLYPIIADAFKRAASAFNIKIVWGGDWMNKDWGHIELDKDAYPDQEKPLAVV